MHFAVQGTWVQALVWEESTCHRATNPVRHDYLACVLDPTDNRYWVRVLDPADSSYWVCVLDPADSSYWAMSLGRLLPTKEATTTGSPHPTAKSSPCSPQLQKAWTTPKTQHSQNE